jgi:hypothetical protein
MLQIKEVKTKKASISFCKQDFLKVLKRPIYSFSALIADEKLTKKKD